MEQINVLFIFFILTIVAFSFIKLLLKLCIYKRNKDDIEGFDGEDINAVEISAKLGGFVSGETIDIIKSQLDDICPEGMGVGACVNRFFDSLIGSICCIILIIFIVKFWKAKKYGKNA